MNELDDNIATKQKADSRVPQNSLLIKLLIIFIVFPVLFLLFRLMIVPLVILGDLLSPGFRTGMMAKILVTIGLIAALGGTITICYKIWPRSK